MDFYNGRVLSFFSGHNGNTQTARTFSIVRTIFLLTASLLTFILGVIEVYAAPNDVQNGIKLYVSKLGDNTDGRSWKTAFNAIQQALDAVPDDKGGHQVEE